MLPMLHKETSEMCEKQKYTKLTKYIWSISKSMHLLATGIVSLSLTPGACLLKSHQVPLITAWLFKNLVYKK